MDLSVLIPSRNEEWLKNTIDDILAHREAKTEVIVVLDGAWPVEPIPDHPDVHLLYMPESIGQRAATNLAARVSRAKYVMKLDGHCAVDQGFDRKMIEPYENKELDWDVTSIPRLFNLHLFNFVCDTCGKTTYQGPTPAACPDCKGVAHHKDIVWKPRLNRRTDAMRFDTELKFSYWGEFAKRPEAKGDFVESLGNLGACFFMHRSRFFFLGGMDEEYGSWGSYGSELSCASWLSGGRQVINKTAWYSHLFRSSPGFGFPYALSGKQVDHAKKRLQSIWFNNAWPKQVRPLSWLIEHFAPVPCWHEPGGAEALARVTKAGMAFARSCNERVSVGEVVALGVFADANLASPNVVSVSGGQEVSTVAVGAGGVLLALSDTGRPAGSSDGSSPSLPLIDAGTTQAHGASARIEPRDQGVTFGTVGSSSVDGGNGVGSCEVFALRGESKVDGIAAGGAVADDVIQDRPLGAEPPRERPAEPSPHQPGQSECFVTPALFAEAVQTNLAVAVPVLAPHPDPASSLAVDGDIAEEAGDGLGVQVRDDEHLVVSHAPAIVASGTRPSPAQLPVKKAILYYSDLRGDPAILEACRRQLLRAAGGIPIWSVTLGPLDFGRNVSLPLERGRLTMFKQQLVGLEVMDADVVFLAEHDVAYHPSHFEFVPPTRDAYYYNEQTIKVDATTGQGVFYYTKQTSGLCADRQLLLEHYRKRVARVERDGYDHAMGYEPGCHQPPRGVDEYPAIRWMSRVPNVDIRHGCNLTKTRWDPAEFRDKSTCQGWTLVDEVPGWGVTKGRFREFLEELR